MGEVEPEPEPYKLAEIRAGKAKFEQAIDAGINAAKKVPEYAKYFTSDFKRDAQVQRMLKTIATAIYKDLNVSFSVGAASATDLWNSLKELQQRLVAKFPDVVGRGIN